MDRKATIVEVSIHLPNQHPLLGDNTIQLKIEDEGNGAFFVLTGSNDEGLVMALRLDWEDIEEIYRQARILMNDWPKESGLT